MLANEQHESHENAKICYICKERFKDKYARDKKYCKVRDHCHYTGEYRDVVHSICNLEYNIPKEITILFHNESNYDYYFIIKELAEEFRGQFSSLGEIYITFSVPKEKEVIGKNGEKITKNISYKLKFVESAGIYGE